MEAQAPAQPAKDPLHRLKYIAYCWSHGAPGEDSLTQNEFVTYAKFQLCQLKHVLMKDPVWDRYTDEEVLVEYFAAVFAQDAELSQSFAASNSSGIFDWMDAQIEKNQVEVAKLQAGKLKEIRQLGADAHGFEFSPQDVMGD